MPESHARAESGSGPSQESPRNPAPTSDRYPEGVRTPDPWLLAVRPRTLPAAVAPLALGASFCALLGPVRPGPLLVALVCALLIQIASNLANDLFDFLKGADTEARLGPTRAVQAGLITPRGMAGGLAVVVALALAGGLYLVAVGGAPILVIGLLSLVSAVLYTGGPYPLGYLGLGEVFVFVFFGPVATYGTVLLGSGRTDAPTALVAALLGVPLGLLCANILVVNNVRDVETDRAANKRTLAARFGRSFGVAMYRAFLVGAMVATLGLALAARMPGLLLGLAVLPAGRALAESVATLHGPPLNPVLGRTAALELRYALLASAGLLLQLAFHRFQ